jgi:hypothetical protein
MHTLFNFATTVQQGIIKFPEWSWVRDGLKRNLGTTIAYYRQNPQAVRSEHFLVRLLQSIAVSQSQNLDRYYANVDALALHMSMALKMTSSISVGKIWDGVFYGEGSQEVLLAHDQEFDPLWAHKNWQNLPSVTVLRHFRSDLGFNLPDGKKTGSEEGLAVIAINIPMLAVQYRAFRLNEINEARFTDSQRSVMQFIHMYVLPNMLPSHVDLAIFNRIDNLAKGAPIGESSKGHPFFLPDTYAKRSLKIQQDILRNFERETLDFVTIMRSIPAVTKEAMDLVFRTPAVAPTRQVDWALTVSRLPMLSFLFRVADQGGRLRNQREINQIVRSVLAYRTGNVMRARLPEDVYYDVQYEIDQIVKLP